MVVVDRFTIVIYELTAVRVTVVLAAGILPVRVVKPGGPFPPGPWVTPGTWPNAGDATMMDNASANLETNLFRDISLQPQIQLVRQDRWEFLARQIPSPYQ